MSDVSGMNGMALTSLGDVRAVLFDVDGTLYAQTPLRACMAAEFAARALGGLSPARVARDARVLRRFRTLREELRALGEPAGERLEDVQYAQTAKQTGVPDAQVRAVIDEWIFDRPLKHLRLVRRSGLLPMIAALEARGLRIGALSDYPVEAKLGALGVADRFSLKLCTTDDAINAFKPHPKGFLHACALWGVAPREVLYVGDRPQIDGVGAAAAGVRCVIVGGSHGHGGDGGARYASIRAFADLARAFAVAS
jgi:FMN phosphatase YigB (HAD superfamily)